MNVLVTGATGFIGRHLSERLTNEGHPVRAFVLPGVSAAWLDALSIEIVHGDVRDYPAVERAMKDCQLVFHLAAQTEMPELPRKIFQAVNVQGTENVVRAALSTHAGRLVFASSTSVYGRVTENRVIDENTPTKPDSPYGESKMLAERIVISHYVQEGLPVVVARIVDVLGPGAMSWLGLFRSIASGHFRLIGSGDNYYHPVDVADVIDGLVLCGTVKGVEGRTYVITGREQLRLYELIRMIGEEVGMPHLPESLPAGPLYLYMILNRLVYMWTGRRLPRADRIGFFLSHRRFDLTRPQRELGYAPKVNIKESVHRMAAWFKAQGYI